MRRMDEEDLNNEQIEQIDMLENAASELFSIMTDGKYEESLEDIYDLLYRAQAIIENNGARAHFPAHIDDGVNSYTIDYTDEEIIE